MITLGFLVDSATYEQYDGKFYPINDTLRIHYDEINSKTQASPSEKSSNSSSKKDCSNCPNNDFGVCILTDNPKKCKIEGSPS